MSRLIIQNLRQELTNDCAWTDQTVQLSSGDLFLGERPFGTYITASYPESKWPTQFIVNVIDGSGVPVLSMPFEYMLGSNDVRPIDSVDSPWSEDGVLIGPIPAGSERDLYTRAAEAVEVARQLTLVEPNLLLHRSAA